MEAAGTFDANIIKKSDESNKENIQQVHDRIVKASAEFSGEMLNVFKNFKQLFSQWKSQSRKTIALCVEYSDIYRKREKIVETAEKSFSSMRSLIDDITEMLEAKMVASSEYGFKYAKAVNFVVNADRDAYQAMEARIRAMSTTDFDSLDSYDSNSAANLKQVGERMEKASSAFDQAMEDKYSKFQTFYQTWKKANQEYSR